MDKKRLLWISWCVPYDTVNHAGGQCCNYYLKQFQKDGRYDITILSLCYRRELPSIDLDRYQIRHREYCLDQNPVTHFPWQVINRLCYWNPWDAYCGICPPYERRHLKRLIREYAEQNPEPEYIILEWTATGYLYPYLHQLFPHARVLLIEEDVTFLSFARHRDAAQDGYHRWLWKKRYEIMLQKERELIRQVDITAVNNDKDKKLLLDQGIEAQKLIRISPFYRDYSYIERIPDRRDVIFFGNMAREENYRSAEWFIRNVMPLLSDCNVRFVVIGASPNRSLLQYQSEQVLITGFCKSPDEYFAHALCLCAPLVLGAGIKVKILESMSAGLPVLTNQIGIEGIDAVDGRDYYFCHTPQEYADRIRELISNPDTAKKMGENARAYVQASWNIRKGVDEMEDHLAGKING